MRHLIKPEATLERMNSSFIGAVLNAILTTVLVTLMLSGLAACRSGLLPKKDVAECTGDDCTAPVTGAEQGEQIWFCYGTTNKDQRWHCQTTEQDPSLIAPPPREPSTGVTDALDKTVRHEEPISQKSAASQEPSATESTQFIASVPPGAPSFEPIAPDSQQETPASPPIPPSASQEPPDAAQETQMSSAPAQARTLTDRVNLILLQSEDFFAVQIAALQDENSVLQFARENGLEDPLYVHITSQGRDWYVLLLGVFPDRLSAAHAIEAWSEGKKLSMNPWVRQLGPLQSAMKAAAG